MCLYVLTALKTHLQKYFKMSFDEKKNVSKICDSIKTQQAKIRKWMCALRTHARMLAHKHACYTPRISKKSCGNVKVSRIFWPTKSACCFQLFFSSSYCYHYYYYCYWNFWISTKLVNKVRTRHTPASKSRNSPRVVFLLLSLKNIKKKNIQNEMDLWTIVSL